ncbi:MAG: Holliday junction branch migration protein RuvA [Lachnospiraceae bacterium]|nr:Holliday junction branch migration protein RuvA [Lachnospiraceae bacterium]
MIAYLRGKYIYYTNDTIILDVNGVGYELKVPLSVIEKGYQDNEVITLYTYMSVSENAINLYGFNTRRELDTFKLLTSVSGIGPKAALSVLSSMTIEDLNYAILSDDVKRISKTPGIGPKGASKIIFELKDKITIENPYENIMDTNESNGISDDKLNDAILALTALGFSNSDAIKAIRNIENADEKDIEDIIRLALGNLSL